MLDVLTTAPTDTNPSTREPLVPKDRRSQLNLETTDKELEADLDHHRFGFFRFHPDWLQVFRNAKFLTLLLSLYSLLEATVVMGNKNI